MKQLYSKRIIKLREDVKGYCDGAQGGCGEICMFGCGGACEDAGCMLMCSGCSGCWGLCTSIAW